MNIHRKNFEYCNIYNLGSPFVIHQCCNRQPTSPLSDQPVLPTTWAHNLIKIYQRDSATNCQKVYFTSELSCSYNWRLRTKLYREPFRHSVSHLVLYSLLLAIYSYHSVTLFQTPYSNSVKSQISYHAVSILLECLRPTSYNTFMFPDHRNKRNKRENLNKISNIIKILLQICRKKMSTLYQ